MRSCLHILIKQYHNLIAVSCLPVSCITIVPLFPQTIAVSKFQVRTFLAVANSLVSHFVSIVRFEKKPVLLNTYVTIFSAHTFILFYACKTIRFFSSIHWTWIYDAANMSIIATPITCKKVWRVWKSNLVLSLQNSQMTR